MAALAKRRMRSTMPLLEQALTGIVHDHHRQFLAMQLAHIDVLDAQIEALNTAIETSLQALSTAEPSQEEQPSLRAVSSVPVVAVSAPLTFTRAVELLDTIPGGDQRGAEVIVAEIGIDMLRFETAPRLAAWAGVAPGNDESAGKQRSGKTRKGNRPLRAILPQLAPAAVRTKDTYLSAFYQRLAIRRGKKRAIIAVAHSMMCSVFHMLSRNEGYRELGANYFDERRRQFTVDRLTRRIERLGYHVHLEPVAVSAAWEIFKATRSQAKLNFHFNASLSAVTFAKLDARQHRGDTAPVFSMARLKRRAFNQHLIERIAQHLAKGHSLEKSSPDYEELCNYGTIAETVA
jgi:transposase